jgi:hypothetical protein
LRLEERFMAKGYVLAVRHNAARQVGADWQQRLAGIPGIQITGGSERRVQFVAEDEEALARVRANFGPEFILEDLVSREPL